MVFLPSSVNEESLKMPNFLHLALALSLGVTYADLFPTTVTEWFWQSCKHLSPFRLLSRIDRGAHTAIVVKDYLYIIGGEQYDPNFDSGITLGDSG
jgi:hypothetical protein